MTGAFFRPDKSIVFIPKYFRVESTPLLRSIPLEDVILRQGNACTRLNDTAVLAVRAVASYC
jgi:hypothetical protein